MAEKNKVVIYYPSYEKGGATKILLNLINYLTSKNFEIFLFSQNVEKKRFENIKYVKLINIENPKFMLRRFVRIYLSLILSVKMFFF